MNKAIHHIFALLLAVSMILSTGAMSFAAEETTPDQTISGETTTPGGTTEGGEGNTLPSDVVPSPADTAPTPTPEVTTTTTPEPVEPTPTAETTPAPTTTPDETETPPTAPTVAPTTTPEVTAQPTPTPEATKDPDTTPTVSAEPSAAPTAAPTTTPEVEATTTPEVTATTTPDVTPTTTPEAAPTATPEATSTPPATPSAAPTPTPAVTVTSTPTPIPTATITPTPMPTETPLPIKKMQKIVKSAPLYTGADGIHINNTAGNIPQEERDGSPEKPFLNFRRAVEAVKASGASEATLILDTDVEFTSQCNVFDNSNGITWTIKSGKADGSKAALQFVSTKDVGGNDTLDVGDGQGFFTIQHGANVTFENISLEGPNSSRTANPMYSARVLHVVGDATHPTHVVLKNTDVKYGYIAGSTENDGGAGIYVADYGTVTIMDGCSITRNDTNGYGGGVMVAQNGTLEAIGDDISITDNTAKRGGGIDSSAKLADNHGKLVLKGEISITNNTATESGGGVYASTQSNVSIAGKVTIKNNRKGAETNNLYLCKNPNSDLAVVEINGETNGDEGSIGISAENERVYRLIAKQAEGYTIVTEPAAVADENAWVDDNLDALGNWDIRYMVYNNIPGLYLYYKTVGATFTDVRTLTGITGKDINGESINYMDMTVPNSTTDANGKLTVPGIIPTSGTEDFTVTLTCDSDQYRIPDNDSINKLLSVTSNGTDVPYEYSYDVEAGTATLTIKADTLQTLTADVDFVVTADKYYELTVSNMGPLCAFTTDVTGHDYKHPQLSKSTKSGSTASFKVERPAGTPYQGVGIKLYKNGTTDGPTTLTTNAAGEVEYTGLDETADYMPVLIYSDKVKVIERDTVSFTLSTLANQYLADEVRRNTTNGTLEYTPTANSASLTNVSCDGEVQFVIRSAAADIAFVGNEKQATTTGATLTLSTQAPAHNNLDHTHTQIIKRLQDSALNYGEVPTATLKGYNFLGWYTVADWADNDTSKQVTADTTYTKGTSATRIYAHWEPRTDTHFTIRHLVEYSAAEGSVNCKGNTHATEADAVVEKNGKKYYILTTTEHNDGVSDKLTDLSVYKLTDAQFACTAPGVEQHTWWTADGFTAAGQAAIPANGEGVLDLYYDRNPYKLIFDNDFQAGTAQKTGDLEPKTVYFASAIGELPTPILPGYTFAGWHDHDGGTIDFTATTPYPTVGDTTVVAKWNANNDTPWAIKILVRDIKKYEADTPDGHKKGEAYVTQFKESKSVFRNGDTVLVGTTDTNREFVVADNPRLEMPGFTYVGYSNTFSSTAEGMVENSTNATCYIKPTDTPNFVLDPATSERVYNPAFDGGIVYLYFIRNRAHVKYEDGDGNIQDPDKEIFYEGDFVGKLPDDIATDGYDFKYWVDADGNRVDAATSANPYTQTHGTDLILHPHWEPWTYQLTYVPGKGNTFKPAPGKGSENYVLSPTVAGGHVDQTKVTYDQPFGTFPSAEKKGHNFIGWYVESGPSANTVLKETDTVSINNVVIQHGRPIPLHTTEQVRVMQAKYEPHTYTLKFDLNPPMDGLTSSETPADITVTYGQKPELPDDPTMSGYRFAGWVLDPAKKGTTRIGNKANAPAWSHVFTDKSVVTAYATWIPATIVFDYDLNDQTGSTRARFIQYDVEHGAAEFGWVYDGIIQMEAQRDGYTFCGWALENPDATPDEVIKKGDVITIPHNSTLYAVWDPIVYDVKLVMRGGTLPDLTSNEELETYNPTATYEVGEDTKIVFWTVKVPFDTTPDFYNHTNALYTPTKEDCTFHGWLAYAPGWPLNEAGKSIHGEAIYSLPTYVDFKDVPGITLTALWEPWFRFDPDGTKFTDNTTDIKVIHQSDLGDKLPEAVKKGYYQDGWVNVEEPDKLVTLGDLKATDSPMTLIPKWSANITFDGNGGQVNGKGIDVIPLSKLDKMPGANKSGFHLTGWYTAAENGSVVSLETLKKNGVPATVYAHWEANSYSGGGGGGGGSTSFIVDFDSNGGSEVPSQTVPSGRTPTKPTAPTKPFYEFTGWFTDKECTKLFNFEKDKIRKNTVLYAGWKYVGPSAYLTTDHIAYICGFTDGTVRPNANISRGEVAMIFYRLLNEQTKTAYKTDKNSYTDVSAADWDNIAISTLTKLGILKGRGNGIFAADDNITRAEFAVICSRFDTLAEGKSTFKDVPASYWAYKEISSAAAKGWVEGYEDGSFRPDNNITRAETITLVNRVLHRATEKFKNTATNSNAMKVWPDNKDLTQWYYVAMQEATHSHDYGFDSENIENWTWIRAAKVRND